MKNGVHFDLDADGVPELTAWTRRDSDDAFLAMDRNRNGRIDDGTELFGNDTPAYADRTDVTTLNGFEALAFLQGSSYGRSRLDHQIDRADAAFARLLLWRDANHNGLSEPDELTPRGGRRSGDRHGLQGNQGAWIDSGMSSARKAGLPGRMATRTPCSTCGCNTTVERIVVSGGGRGASPRLSPTLEVRPHLFSPAPLSPIRRDSRCDSLRWPSLRRSFVGRNAGCRRSGAARHRPPPPLARLR